MFLCNVILRETCILKRELIALELLNMLTTITSDGPFKCLRVNSFVCYIFLRVFAYFLYISIIYEILLLTVCDIRIDVHIFILIIGNFETIGVILDQLCLICSHKLPFAAIPIFVAIFKKRNNEYIYYDEIILLFINSFV